MVSWFEKIADAKCGGLVYEIVLAQARAKTHCIIQRIRAHLALEEQSEGLRSKTEIVKKLAADIFREGRRDFRQ